MIVDYSSLDQRVIPLVKFFNERGLETIMSCQGHNLTNLSMFWIQFSRKVTVEKITQFMMDHRVSFPIREELQGIIGKIGHNFVSNGRFAQRLTVGSAGQPCYSWNYFAANADAADADLANWIQLENERQGA